ncbi:ATP-binding protein [Streptomyces sp. TLI_105]|uniref:ATP-binding protein n=1 Tax=Streptomyces sp. TLI_105 TaxID=1881019 RepID=UPI0008980FDD|nr:ATP-binding protein [Streptomyces sp. TLI_105]SEC82149.1 Histidine kinase-like ATPase domain-containing protein [Streptomyces sp. TLI_105]
MLPLTVELLALPKEVAEVRRMVEGDDVRLCVSELLTNVIRHVGEGAPVTVRVVAARGGRTRVAVTDPDPRAWPVLRDAAEDAESGRGLALLDALAARWGVDQGPSGKTVWCELGAGR